MSWLQTAFQAIYEHLQHEAHYVESSAILSCLPLSSDRLPTADETEVNLHGVMCSLHTQNTIYKRYATKTISLSLPCSRSILMTISYFSSFTTGWS